MAHLLNVCSYNMRGFNSTKIPYVTDLLNIFSILFLVEHWLTNKQLSDLSANFPEYIQCTCSTVNMKTREPGSQSSRKLIMAPVRLEDGSHFSPRTYLVNKILFMTPFINFYSPIRTIEYE